jgi:hypothetical protein
VALAVFGDMVAGFNGANYLHDNNAGKGQKSVRFDLNVPATGVYKVYLRWTQNGNRASNVPVTVRHENGRADHVIDGGVNPVLRLPHRLSHSISGLP